MGYSETGGVAGAPAFSYFFDKILEIEPGLPRKFEVPKGVGSKSIGGENFYYTEQSPLWNNQKTMQDEIIF